MSIEYRKVLELEARIYVLYEMLDIQVCPREIESRVNARLRAMECEHKWVDPSNDHIFTNGHVVCAKCGFIETEEKARGC